MICITPDNVTLILDQHVQNLIDIMDCFPYSEYIVYPLVKLLCRIVKDGNKDSLKITDCKRLCESALSNHEGHIKHYAVVLMNSLQETGQMNDSSSGTSDDTSDDESKPEDPINPDEKPISKNIDETPVSDESIDNKNNPNLIENKTEVKTETKNEKRYSKR